MKNGALIAIIIGIVALFALGMYYEKNAPEGYPKFSIIQSTRSCSSWLVNEKLPSSVTLPYTWQYTGSTRCITALDNINGCRVTYTAGDCTSTPSCTESWTCTDWGTCMSNSQSRTCTDSNNCGTSVNKPAATQSCSTTTTSCGISGSIKCLTTSTYETCLSNGKWSGVLACAGTCSNGECVSSCTPNWQCFAWSDCAGDQQHRTCTDWANCGKNPPITTQSCTTPVVPVTPEPEPCGITGTLKCLTTTTYETCLANGHWSGILSCVGTCSNGACVSSCVSNWQCYEWSTCSGGQQTRSCVDWANCGKNQPTLVQSCTTPGNPTTCTPNWQTGSWSTCSSGTQTRSVTDSNNCGTTTNQPSSSQSCNVVSCTPSWQTGGWSACSNSQQTRTVTDSNNCGTTSGQPSTSQSCNSGTGTNNGGSSTNALNDFFSGISSTTWMIIGIIAGGIILLLVFTKK